MLQWTARNAPTVSLRFSKSNVAHPTDAYVPPCMPLCADVAPPMILSSPMWLLVGLSCLQVRPTAFPKAEGGRSGGPAPIEAVHQDVLAAATAADTPNITWIGAWKGVEEDCSSSSSRCNMPPQQGHVSKQGSTVSELCGNHRVQTRHTLFDVLYVECVAGA